MDITSIIIAVGVIQGLVLSIALFRNRARALYPSVFLCLFCLLVSLITLEDFLLRTRIIFQFPHLFCLFYPLIYVVGPILFLYVKSLTHPHFKYLTKHLLHFIPFFIFLFLAASTIYFNSAEVKKQWIIESYKETGSNFFNYAAISQCFIYILLSLKLLYQHKKNIAKIFSYDERINLNWLRRLMLSVIVLWVIWGLSNLLPTPFFSNLDAVSFPVFVYMLGYWGISQRLVYKETEPNLTESVIKDDQLNNTKPVIKIPESEEKLEMLLNYMQEKKPYLNGELTIQALSSQICIPVNQLSYIINSHLEQNFFEFVNSYRVEEFKQEVLKPENQHLSLLGIALDCGFNSKASFNLVFKKYTGLTPSQYKKQSELQFKTSEIRL